MPILRIKRSSFSVTAVGGLLVLLLFLSGCGNSSPDEERYYEGELAAMRKQELAQEAAEAEKKAALRDGYPWRASKKDDSCLPSRLKTLENRLDNEIKCLNETVHGKKSSRYKFRD